MYQSIINRLQSLPIANVLLFGFLLIALTPILILSVEIYHDAWSDSWREIREKHQLLAENLASPISVYVSTHQQALDLIALRLSRQELNDNASIKRLIRESLSNIPGFTALLIVDGNNKINYCQNVKGDEYHNVSIINHPFFSKYPNPTRSISGIHPSPINGKPSLFISSPINKQLSLSASLNIMPIEKLRRGIKFGKKGHSAIVDQFGRVIAHPNSEWMKERRNLSHLSIVKKMMGGNTGVTEFYSPFIKKDMVAGYTSVKGLGWGIMVPQPKDEIREQVYTIMHKIIIWGTFGFILAIVLALYFARKISNPINALAASAKKITHDNFRTAIKFPQQGVKEVEELGECLQKTIDKLLLTQNQYEELNNSLQQKIVQATLELRKMNERLVLQATSDHLTEIANRRHFETFLDDVTRDSLKRSKHYMLLLLDIDNFKDINDQYGHPVGDQVLKTIAEILRENIREEDIVARYGGDEFIALIQADRDIAWQRASEINEYIRHYQFKHNEGYFNVTTSMGILMLDELKDEKINSLFLKKVDEAMYAAKKQGRDAIIEVALN